MESNGKTPTPPPPAISREAGRRGRGTPREQFSMQGWEGSQKVHRHDIGAGAVGEG